MPLSDLSPETLHRLKAVRLLALDVDGTLTDGGVYYTDAGQEMKRFHIHDGLGIVLARFVNLHIAWITGRTSPLVERRARELKVTLLQQGVHDKVAALHTLAASVGVLPHETAYMGDDLNDIPALRAAGIALAPANAHPEVRFLTPIVTTLPGGTGAVREAIDLILHARGDYDAALAAYLHSLATTAKTLGQ